MWAQVLPLELRSAGRALIAKCTAYQAAKRCSPTLLFARPFRHFLPKPLKLFRIWAQVPYSFGHFSSSVKILTIPGVTRHVFEYFPQGQSFSRSAGVSVDSHHLQPRKAVLDQPLRHSTSTITLLIRS